MVQELFSWLYTEHKSGEPERFSVWRGNQVRDVHGACDRGANWDGEFAYEVIPANAAIRSASFLREVQGPAFGALGAVERKRPGGVQGLKSLKAPPF